MGLKRNPEYAYTGSVEGRYVDGLRQKQSYIGSRWGDALKMCSQKGSRWGNVIKQFHGLFQKWGVRKHNSKI